MQDININLIVKHENGTKWENAAEQALPVLPHVGEHVALARKGDILLYKIVGVFHTVPFKGLTEVFAIHDGTLHEVQDRLLSS